MENTYVYTEETKKIQNCPIIEPFKKKMESNKYKIILVLFYNMEEPLTIQV